MRCLVVLGQIEKEVRGEFLVLVACEVCLDNEVTLEAEAAQLGHISLSNPALSQILTYALDGLALLLGDVDGVRTRGQGSIFICVLHEQLHELLGMLLNQLRQLGVTGVDLLQDGLEHLRLLLHDRSQLLELRIVTQKGQAILTERGSASTT